MGEPAVPGGDGGRDPVCEVAQEGSGATAQTRSAAQALGCGLSLARAAVSGDELQ